MEIINEVDWEKAAHDMFVENMKLKQALEEAYKEADYLEGERNRLRWEKCEVEEELGKLKKEARNRVEQLKNWLDTALNGQTLCTPRVAIRYRHSQIIELDAVFDVPQEYVRTKIENHVDKNALKKAIKAGAAFEGVRLVERKNIQIS